MISIASLAVLLGAACPLPEQSATAQPPQFASPIRLMVGEEPLAGDRLYPSPRLYDIDDDGDAEIVIGDLFGHVHVAEKVVCADPFAWGELEKLMSGQRALKFHNW